MVGSLVLPLFTLMFFISVYSSVFRGGGETGRILEISNFSELTKYLIRFTLKFAFLNVLQSFSPFVFFQRS